MHRMNRKCVFRKRRNFWEKCTIFKIPKDAPFQNFQTLRNLTLALKLRFEHFCIIMKKTQLLEVLRQSIFWKSFDRFIFGKNLLFDCHFCQKTEFQRQTSAGDSVILHFFKQSFSKKNWNFMFLSNITIPKNPDF